MKARQQKEQLDLVTLMMHEAGIRNPTEFAKLAGITPSTLNKKFAGEDDSLLSTSTMLKLRQVVARLSNGRQVDLPGSLATVKVKVIGAVQAGEWLEALEWTPEDQYTVVVPAKGWAGIELHALEVRGPSMNRIYPDRSVIVWCGVHELGREPRNGERVVVRRTDRTGLVEATVKTLREDGNGGRWLWPESDHPEHQMPLKMDGEEIQVLGVVVYSLRPEIDYR